MIVFSYFFVAISIVLSFMLVYTTITPSKFKYKLLLFITCAWFLVGISIIISTW